MVCSCTTLVVTGPEPTAELSDVVPRPDPAAPPIMMVFFGVDADELEPSALPLPPPDFLSPFSSALATGASSNIARIADRVVKFCNEFFIVISALKL